MAKIVLTLAVGVLAALMAVPVGAAVLCAKKSGAVFLRNGEQCKGKEARVNPSVAGLQGPSGPPGLSGQDGEDGEDGVDGEDGHDGRDADTTRLPVAFGVINPDGTIASGTGNISVRTISGTRYEITITGERYSLASYVAVVTPISTSFRTATSADTTAGALVVTIFDATGAPLYDNFSFMVLKTTPPE